MQHFTDKSGNVFAFDDDVSATETDGVWSFRTATGAPLALPADLTPCPNNQPPGPTMAQLWTDYQRAARAALDQTDMVALRCWKAGVTFPADWQTYTQALRAVVGAATGDPTKPLPTAPSFPAGT